jgi:hypothetical protein
VTKLIVLFPNAINDVAVSWLPRWVQVVDSRKIEQDATFDVVVSWGLLDLVDSTSHLTCPTIDVQHGTFMHETWQSFLLVAATLCPGFARPLETNLNRIPVSAERGETTERMPWLSSHKERNGDHGRRDPGLFRSWAASCPPFLERVETNQQRLRVAAALMALSELHRQSPKFHRVPHALLAESTRHRQTERPHAEFPIPAPPSIHPPSPSHLRSLETHESTRTTALRAVTQDGRKGIAIAGGA